MHEIRTRQQHIKWLKTNAILSADLSAPEEIVRLLSGFQLQLQSAGADKHSGAGANRVANESRDWR